MIAITGANGFLGKHCKIYCKINDIKNVLFIDKKNFRSKNTKNFLEECQYFIHLAGINKSSKSDLYKNNLNLNKYYLNILSKNKNLKKIIFTSSIHRDKKNQYGRSKLNSENLLKNFCISKNIKLKILILTNIFGEFCKPNYNSVIATICNEVMNDKDFKIKINKNIKLIYVKDVVNNIFSNLKKNKTINNKHYTNISLNNLLIKIERFKADYFNNVIPKFKNNFELNLFNTFRSYAFPKRIILKTKSFSDKRGSLWEVIKSKRNAHMFMSTTKKNNVRGNHFHTKKIERFIIMSGCGVIKFRHIFDNKIYKFKINSKDKNIIDIPTYCTHNLSNNKSKELITLFYSNEIYNPKKTDTYYEKV